MTLRNLSRIAAFVAAIGLTPAAQAQTTDLLTLQVAPSNTAAVSRQTCLNGGSTAVAYNFPQGVGTDTSIRLSLYLTKGGSCPDDPPDDAEELISDSLITSTTVSGLRQVPATTLGGTDCPTNREIEWLACAVATNQVSDLNGVRENVLAKAQVELTYDAQPPAAPQITAHEFGDATIYLTWTATEDAGEWIIYYRPIGDPPPATIDECGTLATASSYQVAGEDAGVDAGADAGQDAGAGLDAGSIDLTGWSTTTIDDGELRKGSIERLTNGQEYEVLIVARDIAGNDSAPSNRITETPKNVQDFYERYRCQGGQETGGFGCSTAGMALVPVAGLAALALLRRAGRRKA